MNQYEAMFLFDPTFASDFGKAKGEIERILQRAGAEVVFLEKWEERKLAYDIQGRKRGCYVLTYFNCDGSKITGIERDAQLSEPILRILVKSATGITREKMEQFMPQARSVDDDRPGSPERADDRRSAPKTVQPTATPKSVPTESPDAAVATLEGAPESASEATETPAPKEGDSTESGETKEAVE